MKPARPRREIDARVVQRKHHLEEGPGAQDRGADQRQMPGLRPAGHILHRAELPDDRRDRRASRHDPQRHQHPLVLVLGPRLNARVPSRVRHHRRDHDEERPRADVPGDKKARRLPDFEAKREIGRDHEDRPRQQARPMGKSPRDAARGRRDFRRRRRFGHAKGRSEFSGARLARRRSEGQAGRPRRASPSDIDDCAAVIRWRSALNELP